ncbi:OST-HTH/LOTUS domain-containing protein [Massilia soli]|uniref:OST-HTH/LOTUS domain-containing protein n=1 Tax=Massilia soli TaxID=2792854 RepID=A0ABS7SRL4_9BURK|nr:OST-HTH/LOTUS domain-containing protein [Massilia soli]MBZ2208579.1 OST-HTH/LOTUS domain-containing protein [Massilia soli]
MKALQQDVQRNLGRCMLRLQQYEGLLKAMVAEVAVEGRVQDLHATRDKKRAKLRNKTLGALVGVFAEGYLSIELPVEEVGPKDDSAAFPRDPDVAWMSMRFSMAMPPEVYTQTKDNLAELVALRNDLVHHLIDQFDLFNDGGCRAAVTHLDTCYERIDGHFVRLRDWATTLAETQALASSFLQSKVFEDAFVHGINPDGSVCWPQSTIVECLREAESSCQVDGWTSLDAAIRFISKENRDQIPSRYGCKTWRQVLRKSGLFELRCPAPEEGAMGRAWYRSHPEVPASP